MPMPGLPEILTLLLLALLLFGPGRISNLAKELGRSIHAFQEGLHGEFVEETRSESPSSQAK